MDWIDIKEFNYTKDGLIVNLLVQDSNNIDNWFVTSGTWDSISGRFDALHEIVHDEIVTHFCELPEVDESLIGILPD